VKIIRSREHTINMGAGTYESMKIGATIEFDENEVPLTHSNEEFAEERLDLLLKGDLEEAVACIVPGTDSHAEQWRK
jgi:hypothetical protein